MITIGSARQLRYSRHLFWVFISLAKVDWAYHFFVVLASVDYSMFLVFLGLAARFLVIAHYKWYKKNVNNKAVTFITLGGTLVMFLAITSSFFWLGFIPYTNCTISLTLLFYDFTYDLILGVARVTLHALIFIKARILIKSNR